ncbi:MAG TPA: sulfatase-like hydrolase/transferase [Armatimonadota bacterium]|nr:sulfatase-like hydrolase/transferase [Armatimonadota bacterium]
MRAVTPPDPLSIRGRGVPPANLPRVRPANFGPAMSLLVVCLDALRPDHVTPEIMPNLCDFLGHGHRFEGVQTPKGWTLPSVGSMLYGREDAFMAGPANMVGHPTIAGRLAGTHATAAFLGQPVFKCWDGLWMFRDFGHVAPYSTGKWTPRPIAQILPQLDTWRAGLLTGLPWFAYVHFVEPHEPYLPEAWYGAWESPPEKSKSLSAGSIRGLVDAETGRLKASDAVADYLRRRYRAYCTAADGALAPLWEQVLAEKDLATIVVSDHGDGMGEDGVWHHSGLPAFQKREILEVLFGAVPPGGRWPRGIPGNVTTNAELWRLVEACLPRGAGSDEAQVREKLAAIGYLE